MAKTQVDLTHPDIKGWRKNKNASRKSSTPGKLKGENCQASSLDRFYAKYSRAHKHPGYGDWLLRKKGTK
jgi:hypothetical protein